MNDHILARLTIGAGSPLLGIAVSHQVINQYLQTVSLLTGIVVGFVTLVSMILKMYRK